MCLNNLKQISLGIHLYASDNADISPNTGATTYLNYKEAIKNYVGLHGPASPQDKIFACPADVYYYDEGRLPMCRTASHEQIVYYYSRYAFNGLNLFTNYQRFRLQRSLAGIGGQKLGAVKNSARTVLVLESSAMFPYSWHQPKSRGLGVLPLFNDAKNLLGFVDGHVSEIKIYWNSAIRYPNGSLSGACYYDPPIGYDYQWSGN